MSDPPALDDVHGALTLPEGRAVADVAGVARALRPGAVTHVVGAQGSAAPLLARAVRAATGQPVVLVVADADAAVRASHDLAFLSGALPLPGGLGSGLGLGRPLVLTAPDVPPHLEVQPDRRQAMARAAALARLATGDDPGFLVVSAGALLRRVVPRRVLGPASETIAEGAELDPTALAGRLTARGYLRVPVVEDPGTFALRGALIDVWAPGEPSPVRIELLDELVLSLKRFDADDQRTLERLERLVVPPAREAVLDEATEVRARAALRALCDAVDWPSRDTRALIDDVVGGRALFGTEGYLPAFHELVPLAEYLPPTAAVILEDPAALAAALRAERERALAAAAAAERRPHFPLGALLLELDEVPALVAGRAVVACHRLGVGGAGEGALGAWESAPAEAPTLALRDHEDLARAVKHSRQEAGREGALAPLLRRLAAWREAGLPVVLAARVATQAQRVAALLGHRGVAVDVLAAEDPTPRPDAARVRVVVGGLERGVVAPALGLVLLTEEEVFGHRAHRAPQRKRSPRGALEDLRALAVGDHVVHVDHGVGRYVGLARQVVNGAAVELLVVEYQGGDKLYLPVHRLNQVQKFSGGEGAPRLDRLGGSTFAKTKAKVQRRVRQMADELLRLYAERAALQKEPLPPPDDDYATFEATFPFEETRDQAAAIADVMADLGSPRVMDRLVCGDVGFGKTEVAIRAAFRCASQGRQVALLCPTTVLAQQHYNSFRARLADHALTVRALSRFQGKEEQAETLRLLKEGKVDIVIGTHRLLSKDVFFKRLGLLVVDEEQRFGVTHKERIKQLRASVDALTLSATPIPRTLQMAIGGLREMSLITTPPVDRRAIRTLTSQHDEGVIREAVERELARGGQVFYVYNRVEGIYEKAARLQALVPRARVVVGHGQMGEAALESTMVDFVAGEYDVLCATAIIESGIDIPRANTIIIDRADLFGLAQLYQLRGRVGRSSERAYCYLMVPPQGQLTEEARSRIEALERYTELGSGFQVAALDMELRGAGELLGAEQSGFSSQVGFDLFCQMLEEATHELRGETVVHEVEPELSVDADALLPDDYVADVGVRLSLYKRLAGAADEHEVAALASEMEDRFGPPPREALRLVELMRLKTELRRLRVLGMDATARAVTLRFRDDTPLDPRQVGALAATRRAVYRLLPDGSLTRRAGDGEGVQDGLELADRMLAELASCVVPAGPG